MGALGVLMAIGLFDVEGGASVKPAYQITSPRRKNRDEFG
jgi:hypothetical protein